MFDCPNCGAETKKLIGSNELKKIVCPFCYEEKRTPGYQHMLHDVIAQKDGHKVTRGKQSEIDGRYISLDDHKTVISKDNGGREARY